MTSYDNFNPIIAEGPLGLLDVAGHATGHSAVVYLATDSAPVIARVYVTRAPSLRRRLRTRFWRFEVDVAQHASFVSLHLPSKEEAYHFTGKVCFTWAVADPAAIARSGVRDARSHIWQYLNQLLRGISRHYSIEESGPAEGEMDLVLQKESGEIAHGIRLSSMSVDLSLDEAAQRHLASRVDSRRATELDRDEHTRRMQREHQAAEVGQLRGALDLARVQHERSLEMARDETRRSLDRLTAQHAQKMALTAEEHANEIQKLTTAREFALKDQRLRFYRNAVDGGSLDVLVLQLTEHPEDVTTVARILQENNDRHYDRSQRILKDLLDRELMNAADAEPLRQHVIHQLNAALNQSGVRAAVEFEHNVHARTARKDGIMLTDKEESTRFRAT